MTEVCFPPLTLAAGVYFNPHDVFNSFMCSKSLNYTWENYSFRTAKGGIMFKHLEDGQA